MQVGNAPAPSSPPLIRPLLISPTSPEDVTWRSYRDERDLTPWLYAELKAGIYNPDVQFIRTLVQLSSSTPRMTRYGNYGSSVSSGAGSGLYGTALIYWQALVRNKARYDFKHKIGQEFSGDTILFRSENGHLLWSERSVPGNIFFGYVGASVGFPGWLTHIGAGVAEVLDPAHARAGVRNICDIAYFPADRIVTLGDDPADYRTIQFGVDLWNKYHTSLSWSVFRRELDQNYEKLTKPPVLPESGGIAAYPWKNPRGGWPYPIGHFMGSDAEKWWPPRPENMYGFQPFGTGST